MSLSGLCFEISSMLTWLKRCTVECLAQYWCMKRTPPCQGGIKCRNSWIVSRGRSCVTTREGVWDAYCLGPCVGGKHGIWCIVSLMRDVVDQSEYAIAVPENVQSLCFAVLLAVRKYYHEIGQVAAGVRHVMSLAGYGALVCVCKCGSI